MKAVNIRSVYICPWALREGIILHYLQTTLTETFVLPLPPLTSKGNGQDGPGSRRDGRIALVTSEAT